MRIQKLIYPARHDTQICISIYLFKSKIDKIQR